MSTLTSAQKTILTIIGGIVLLGIIGALTATSIANHESSDTFLTRLTTLVSVGVGAIASVAALFRSTQNAKAIDEVKTLTNGNTTKLLDTVAVQSSQLAANPAVVSPVPLVNTPPVV